jgi:hypothetical protein
MTIEAFERLSEAFHAANRADTDVDFNKILRGLSAAASDLDSDDPKDAEILAKIYLSSDMSRRIKSYLETLAVTMWSIVLDVRLKELQILSDAGITGETGTIPGSTLPPPGAGAGPG